MSPARHQVNVLLMRYESMALCMPVMQRHLSKPASTHGQEVS